MARSECSVSPRLQPITPYFTFLSVEKNKKFPSMAVDFVKGTAWRHFTVGLPIVTVNHSRVERTTSIHRKVSPFHSLVPRPCHYLGPESQEPSAKYSILDPSDAPCDTSVGFSADDSSICRFGLHRCQSRGRKNRSLDGPCTSERKVGLAPMLLALTFTVNSRCLYSSQRPGRFFPRSGLSLRQSG